MQRVGIPPRAFCIANGGCGQGRRPCLEQRTDEIIQDIKRATGFERADKRACLVADFIEPGLAGNVALADQKLLDRGTAKASCHAGALSCRSQVFEKLARCRGKVEAGKGRVTKLGAGTCGQPHFDAGK